MHTRKKRYILYLLLLAIAAILLDTIVANSMAETSDEESHIGYGARLLRLQPDRVERKDDSKMPISAFNAIPRAVAGIMENHHHLSAARWFRDISIARYPTIAATLLLGFFVYLWTLELYGSEPAIASAFLFVLSPNLIAHGTLATTDLYFTLGVVVAVYYFRWYLLEPTLQNASFSEIGR